MFKDDIHQGATGLVIGHRTGPDVRTYGVRFTLDRGRTAVFDDLTDQTSSTTRANPCVALFESGSYIDIANRVLVFWR
jgi:hypothetical protein